MYILKKFECTSLNNFSFDDVLFYFILFWHYFDVFFESTFFIFYVWEA
jgi:hypothetical protein